MAKKTANAIAELIVSRIPTTQPSKDPVGCPTFSVLNTTSVFVDLKELQAFTGRKCKDSFLNKVCESLNEDYLEDQIVVFNRIVDEDTRKNIIQFRVVSDEGDDSEDEADAEIVATHLLRLLDAALCGSTMHPATWPKCTSSLIKEPFLFTVAYERADLINHLGFVKISSLDAQFFESVLALVNGDDVPGAYTWAFNLSKDRVVFNAERRS